MTKDIQKWTKWNEPEDLQWPWKWSPERLCYVWLREVPLAPTREPSLICPASILLSKFHHFNREFYRQIDPGILFALDMTARFKESFVVWNFFWRERARDLSYLGKRFAIFQRPQVPLQNSKRLTMIRVSIKNIRSRDETRGVKTSFASEAAAGHSPWRPIKKLPNWMLAKIVHVLSYCGLQAVKCSKNPNLIVSTIANRQSRFPVDFFPVTAVPSIVSLKIVWSVASGWVKSKMILGKFHQQP